MTIKGIIRDGVHQYQCNYKHIETRHLILKVMWFTRISKYKYDFLMHLNKTYNLEICKFGFCNQECNFGLIKVQPSISSNFPQ